MQHHKLQHAREQTAQKHAPATEARRQDQTRAAPPPAQRCPKLLLAHPPQLEPNPRRTRRQYLLPRNPKRLRKHRAFSLPATSFSPLQRRHLQLAKQPYRQRDHAVALGPSSRLKPSHAAAYDSGISAGRSTPRTPGRAAPRPPQAAAPAPRSAPQTGCGSRPLPQHRTDAADQPRRQRQRWPRAQVCLDPTRSTPKTSANSPHSTSSCGVRGNRPTRPVVPGR